MKRVGEILDAWVQRSRFHLENGEHRISKAIVDGKARYTCWRKTGSGWEQVGVRDSADEAKALAGKATA
jgi:hypothetical protein